MSADSERHNKVIRPILDLMVRDGDKLVDEASAMIVMESVAAGLMMLYRPRTSHAAEYLDVMTERVLQRMVDRGATR